MRAHLGYPILKAKCGALEGPSSCIFLAFLWQCLFMCTEHFAVLILGVHFGQNHPTCLQVWSLSMVFHLAQLTWPWSFARGSVRLEENYSCNVPISFLFLWNCFSVNFKESAKYASLWLTGGITTYVTTTGFLKLGKYINVHKPKPTRRKHQQLSIWLFFSLLLLPILHTWC